ncbi:MAG TPA: ABC transporter permease [bacterium]|nr:ABC transporter permease [bacterium]
MLLGAALLLLVAQTLRISIPLALAASGGSVCERSGVINIALEGMLLLGAFGYVLGAHAASVALGVGEDVTGTAHLLVALAGLAGAIVGGLFLAAIHALVTVVFKADQVVSGVALNLLAAGLSKFLLKLVFDSSSNSAPVAGLPGLPLLSSLPTVGSALGAPLLWITALVVAFAHVALFRAVWGLRVRAVGEHPGAAEAAGIDVTRVRVSAVLLSGVLAALGGAWLAADQRQFTEGMSAGRGYIALAAVVFGKWRPTWAAAACVLFAVVEALQIQLQGTSVPLPTQILQVLPHLVALGVLAGAVGAARPPAALGKTWPER